MLRILFIALAVLAAIGIATWIGFRVPVRPFARSAATATPPTRPVPEGLPAPVERYLRAVSLDGETLPDFRAFEYRGTGWARPFGIWLPVRHRAFVVPGETMFRVMEFPWYRVTLLHVEDTYLDGAGATEISGLIQGRTTGPRTDQGAFLALAAESIMVPSTEALRGRWEAVDGERARLVVPGVPRGSLCW